MKPHTGLNSSLTWWVKRQSKIFGLAKGLRKGEASAAEAETSRVAPTEALNGVVACRSWMSPMASDEITFQLEVDTFVVEVVCATGRWRVKRPLLTAVGPGIFGSQRDFLAEFVIDVKVSPPSIEYK